MFGKVMSLPDALMIPYYEFATLVPLDAVRAVEADLREGRAHPRDVKLRLAWEITARYHGEPAARAAEEEFARVFRAHELPDEIPDVPLPPDALRDGTIRLAHLLVALGLAESNGEARRVISQGGVSLDGKRIPQDADRLVADGVLARADVEYPVRVRDGLVVRVGRRRLARVRLGA